MINAHFKDGVIKHVHWRTALIRGKSILTTAVGALTTAVVIANMPWFSGRSPKFDLEELRKAKLIRVDGSNKQISGRELWQESGAVIMVVRRAG